MTIERTLIVFKPDAVQRGVVGEILARFEKVGLKIVALKMISPDEDHYYGHYEEIGKVKTRHGDDIYKINSDFMMQGPVIAGILEGTNAIEQVRKMVGKTEPKAADPGTIRGDYAHMNYARADSAKTGIPNLIHASAEPSEAEQEIKHWFGEDEIHHQYSTVHEKFM